MRFREFTAETRERRFIFFDFSTKFKFFASAADFFHAFVEPRRIDGRAR